MQLEDTPAVYTAVKMAYQASERFRPRLRSMPRGFCATKNETLSFRDFASRDHAKPEDHDGGCNHDQIEREYVRKLLFSGNSSH